MFYLELHNRFSSNCVAWMLLSGHQKLGLFSGQDYKPTGKPLPLAFFASELTNKIDLDLLLEAAH